MPKVQIGNENLSAAIKSVKQGFKLEDDRIPKIKPLLSKYEIKGVQELYDYLIVSGIIYLKRDIVELVRDRAAQLKDRKKSANGKGKSRKIHTVYMYPPDYQAFSRFCIQEDLKKFWIIEILFDAFIEENPMIIDHIKECQKLEITKREKQIVRLLNDEFIVALGENDSHQLLKLFTEKYDSKAFGGNLQEEVGKFLEQKKIVEEEQAEEDVLFKQKMATIRLAREKMAKLTNDSD